MKIAKKWSYKIVDKKRLIRVINRKVLFLSTLLTMKTLKCQKKMINNQQIILIHKSGDC